MNRNAIKLWSITFPQCEDWKRKDFAEMFPPYDEVLVCQEEHLDGGFHLHMGVKFTKGITKKALLNWIKKKFPDDYMRIDIEATRSVTCWEKYLKKEDPEAYSWKDETLMAKKKAKCEEKLKDIIRNNQSLEDWKKDNSRLYGYEQHIELQEDPVFKDFEQENRYYEWIKLTGGFKREDEDEIVYQE